MIYKENWYLEKVSDLYDNFHSSLRGLNDYDVHKNRKNFGVNVLNKKKTENFLHTFISQFKSYFIVTLLIASLIVISLGEYLDGLIIFSIIIVNSIIGAVQEGKAKKTLMALQDAVTSYSTVIRDEKTIVIKDIEVVAGDILVLKDGDLVPADARLIETNSFLVNQSVLTGESVSVAKKNVDISSKNLPIVDQVNMVFKGTYVVSGLAYAIVVSVGPDTIIGNIAEKLETLHTDVPLQNNIKNLSKIIILSVLALSFVIFLVGIFNGQEVVNMFLTVVALSVAAIPESLPVVVTLVLVAGVFRMSKKNVLVKRLQAVEALGQASILALDKTGTITSNEMQVTKVFANDKLFDVTGSGYEPVGEIFLDNSKVIVEEKKSLDLIAKISALTSIASIEFDEEKKVWKHIMGDPTEAALKVFAEKLGFNKNELEREYKNIFEIPFNFHNKYHATVNRQEDEKTFFVSGSPEKIIGASNTVYKNGEVVTLSVAEQERIKKYMQGMAENGQRVIACAVNFNVENNYSEIEKNGLKDLTFVGLLGVQDAIRPEVKDAVKRAQQAGIKIVMITGDYETTAVSIATEVGIFCEGDSTLSGIEIDKISEVELLEKVKNTAVFFRVSPQHKLKIIEAYKKNGEIIAMTGDGINDALSLTDADLGIAMGKKGTEVAREASDIVLVDDNFDNVTSAVEEGRNMYSTIRKSILYLLSTNMGEMMVIVFAVFLVLPLPLLASQIIWLNMVTDTFLVAALALEPKNRKLVFRRPEKPSKWIVDRLMVIRILSTGILMTIGTLVLFINFLPDGLEKAWTISLTTLTVFQWFNLFNIRSKYESIFSKRSFNNKYLLLGLILAIVLHFLAIYHPFMQTVLHTTALNIVEWSLILVVSVSIVVFEEIRKFFFRPKYI
ncbi:HAD-IC family P-type ATPase [Candidatus Nomurabacteria bacterium]|nr:HAD-IC family P-type ATPase [Candidatus Nomurabacteria bacterium]